MSPLETLARELSPSVADAALRALCTEAERIRDGRSTVMVIITFDAGEEPKWVKAIRTDTPGRYQAIHHDEPPGE